MRPGAASSTTTSLALTLRKGYDATPSTEAMQRGFEELADTLGKLVDRPDEVALVVAVSLASAAQRRQPGVENGDILR